MQINEEGTVIDESSGSACLKISHPSSAYHSGIRGYIDTQLPELRCSMDVQTGNGGQMLMKYVTSHVSQGKDSFHSNVLYSSTAPPATAALKYAMSLDVAEPEMWVLLTSRKLSWTNATRKKYSLQVIPEIAAKDRVLEKYYSRSESTESLSLGGWLRIVDDTQAVPERYLDTKAVLVGLRFCSVFKSGYFFQYLVAHYPHRILADIYPPEDMSIPDVILYFHKVHHLLPTVFPDGISFAKKLGVYGHKDYFLEIVASYVQSLIDMNNLYRRGLLPCNAPSALSCSDANRQLQGNQMVFYTNFKHMVDARDREIMGSGTVSDIDLKVFPLVERKPGSGKLYALQHCIEYCVENDIDICVAMSTGTLACRYRELYPDNVVCDTLHSVFKVKCHDHTSSTINSSLCRYDAIFIDEVSQVSTEMFHHIINTISVLAPRPLLVLCGDFCQQQPLITRHIQTVQGEQIVTSHHCMSYVQRFTMTQQHRVTDDALVEILNHIRYDIPPSCMLETLSKDRVLLGHEEHVTNKIYEQLEKLPDSLVLTVTRRSSSIINDILTMNLFRSPPVVLVVADDQSLLPIHIGMKVMITSNMNKASGIVNGQFVIVHSIAVNTLVCRLPT